MGSDLYDFLSDSRLFDEKLIEAHFEHVSERELAQDLEKYWEYCSERLEDIVEEVPSATGTNLYFGQTPNVAVLKRSPLYVPCHIVNDPLLAHARRGAADDVSGPFLS